MQKSIEGSLSVTTDVQMKRAPWCPAHPMLSEACATGFPRRPLTLWLQHQVHEIAGWPARLRMTLPALPGKPEYLPPTHGSSFQERPSSLKARRCPTRGAAQSRPVITSPLSSSSCSCRCRPLDGPGLSASTCMSLMRLCGGAGRTG